MTRTSHRQHAASAVRSAVRGAAGVRAGEERAATGPLVALRFGALCLTSFDDARGVLLSRALLPDLVLPRPSAA